MEPGIKAKVPHCCDRRKKSTSVSAAIRGENREQFLLEIKFAVISVRNRQVCRRLYVYFFFFIVSILLLFYVLFVLFSKKGDLTIVTLLDVTTL